MFRTTKKHTAWWKNREIDWEQDYLLADGALNHPHRQLILDRLAQLQWSNIVEVGMGAGANLVRIQRQWPSVEVGGIDINREAVLVASKYLKKAKYLDVGDARDIFLSDGTINIVLSDACLIYLGPWAVRKALREMKRVSRNYLVLCELHSEKPPWFYRYNVHNYQKLLEEIDCFNIRIEKIPPDIWPGTPWEEYGCIISAEHV